MKANSKNNSVKENKIFVRFCSPATKRKSICFFPLKGGVIKEKLNLLPHFEESGGPTSNLRIWQLILYIRWLDWILHKGTPPKFEYSLSRPLITFNNKDIGKRSPQQYYIKMKNCYDLWFIINVTSLCLFFLALVFLGIGFFFRNVIERLVKVERFGSNKQNVLN